MNILKLKSIFFSLMAITMVTVFLSSCEKDEILDSEIIEIDSTSDIINSPYESDLQIATKPNQVVDKNSLITNRHYVYEKESKILGTKALNAFTSATYELSVRSEVSHGSHGGGYYKSNADVCVRYSNEPLFCVNPPATISDIWVYQEHYYWDSGRNDWRVCTKTGWVKNSGNKQKVELAINHPSNDPVCGDGYYGNMTYTYFYNEITSKYEWGPTVWSGYHYLPN